MDPLFGPFFLGKLLSATGIWTHNIVAAILAFQLTGSALVVGMVSVCQFVPQLVLAPWSGSMADRGNRHRQVILGRLVSGAGSGGLALWIWVTGVNGLAGPAPILAAALVVGVGFVVGGPAMHALLPALVRPGELPAAVALDSVPMVVARAVGPAAGAVVAATLGPAAGFALAAGSNLLFALLVCGLRVPSSPGSVSGKDGSVRAGLRHLRADPTVLRLLLGVTAVGVGADPAITLAPPLAVQFGGGSALVGLFTSAFGIGAGLAFVVLAPARRVMGLARLASLGLLLLATGLGGLAVSPTRSVAVAAFVIAGVGMTSALTTVTTLLQARVPDDMRGRIMGLWLVGFLGSRPFAATIDGAIADAISVNVALVFVAIFVAFAVVLTRPGRILAGPCEFVPDGPADAASHRRAPAGAMVGLDVRPSGERRGE